MSVCLFAQQYIGFWLQDKSYIFLAYLSTLFLRK